MMRLLLIACLIVAIQAGPTGVFKRHRNFKTIFPNGKIIGGQETTIDKVPWQVALEDGGLLFCSGSIISENYILTAAHCTDEIPIKLINIRSGTSKLQNGGTVTNVTSLVQNQNFTQRSLDYDVSVIRLATPLVLGTSQNSVTLRKTEASANETAQVSGWGITNEEMGQLSTVLQAVKVPVVSREECNDAYDDDITERMICAGEAGRDSCLGDNGGALTINNQQVGIVSRRHKCGVAGSPGIYSNVAAFADFINANSNSEARWA